MEKRQVCATHSSPLLSELGEAENYDRIGFIGSGTERRRAIDRLSLQSTTDHSELLHADITESIIGAFFEVYNTLGCGFLEFPYSLAMERELIERKRHVGREVAVPLFYKADQLCTYRLDMLVDHQVVVEIKSADDLPRSAIRQLNNYLAATRLEVGLLLHFGPKPKFYRQCVVNKEKNDVVVSVAYPIDPIRS